MSQTITLMATGAITRASQHASYANARLAVGSQHVFSDRRVCGLQLFYDGIYACGEGFATFDTSRLAGQTITAASLVVTQAFVNVDPSIGQMDVHIARSAVGSGAYIPPPQLPSPQGTLTVSGVSGPGTLTIPITDLTAIVPHVNLCLVMYTNRLLQGIPPSPLVREDVVCEWGLTQQDIRLVVTVGGTPPPPPQGSVFTFSHAAANRFTKILATQGGGSESLYTGGFTLALFTTPPTRTAPGTEPSGGGYARATLPAFQVSGKTAACPTAVSFPPATANWGTITHWGVFSVNPSEFVGFGQLAPPITVTSGDTVGIPAGNFSITVTTESPTLDTFFAEMVFKPSQPLPSYIPDAGSSVRVFHVSLHDQTGTELSGSNYSRKTLHFGQPSNGSVVNAVSALFGPAASNWPVIHSVRVWWGSLLRFHIPLTTPLVVVKDAALTVPVGNLGVQM